MNQRCIKCGVTMDIDQFYKHPQMANGHLGKCKSCCKDDEKLRRISKPEFIKEYEKKRAAAPGRAARSIAATKKWRERYPDRYKAHRAVSNAIRSGTIEKADRCAICRSRSNLHAHHYDYSRPLDVIWLCAKCHGQIQ